MENLKEGQIVWALHNLDPQPLKHKVVITLNGKYKLLCHDDGLYELLDFTFIEPYTGQDTHKIDFGKRGLVLKIKHYKNNLEVLIVTMGEETETEFTAFSLMTGEVSKDYSKYDRGIDVWEDVTKQYEQIKKDSLT